MKLLFNDNRADINHDNKERETPLYITCHQGSIKL